MSIALDTLVIFLFILIPGITFRRFYFQGEFTKQFNSRTLAHSMIASILPGMLIQLITLFLYTSYYKSVNGKMIKGFYEDVALNKIPQTIFDFEILISLLLYISLMLIISWLLAEISWRLVRLTKLDRIHPLFRFRNHWNYYFKGEVADFKEFKGLIKGSLLEVRADVLVQVDDKEPRLYSGILAQHTINNDTHELENVYLTNVGCYIKNAKTQKREKRGVPGDIMIFSAKNIININLNYISTQKKIKNNSNFFGIIYLSIITFVIFSRNDYFNSHTLLRTIIIKIFFIVYFLFIYTVIVVWIKNVAKLSGVERLKNISPLLFLLILMSVLYYVTRFIIY